MVQHQKRKLANEVINYSDSSILIPVVVSTIMSNEIR